MSAEETAGRIVELAIGMDLPQGLEAEEGAV